MNNIWAKREIKFNCFYLNSLNLTTNYFTNHIQKLADNSHIYNRNEVKKASPNEFMWEKESF